MGTLTIRPLCTGIATPPGTTNYYEALRDFYNPAAFMEMPAFTFLVEGGDRLLLVDTGFPSPAYARQNKLSKAPWPDDVTVIHQLKRAGFEPEDIDDIVITHLHWDHCSHMAHFPNARFFVHPKELAFAHDPLPMYYQSYLHPALGLKRPYDHLKLEPVVEGDEIMPGVTVLETPGHTPGHIALSVDAPSGEYLLVGDAILHMDNIKPVPSLHYSVSPPARNASLIDCCSTLEMLRARAKSTDYLLATHDIGLVARAEKTPVLR